MDFFVWVKMWGSGLTHTVTHTPKCAERNRECQTRIIAIRVENQTATIYRDTETALPVLFYDISDGIFGAHFYNAVSGSGSMITLTFF